MANRKLANYLTMMQKAPAKMLTHAYILALSIIAVLTIIGHMMTGHITHKQKEGSEIAYAISRQRALTQEVMIHAAEYYKTQAQLDRDFLTQTINEMEAGHAALIKTIKQRKGINGTISDALLNVYFNEPFTLDKQTVGFIDLVRQFAGMQTDAESQKHIDALKLLMTRKSGPMIRTLDMALDNYQTEVLGETEKFSYMQMWSMIFVLIVLLMEAFFIFRPLVRRIHQYNQMLLRHAMEDHLTGLNNRRAFVNRASSELKRADRDHSQSIVVLSDLDRFKSINDTYGHKAGDLVLQHYAGILKEMLRSGDVIGRIGGEEFAILLPRTDDKQGFMTIDRLRDRVASTPCTYLDDKGVEQSLSYTASFGLVAVVDQGRDIDELLAAADIGLYQAKESGRNRVIAVALEPATKAVTNPDVVTSTRM